MLIIIVVGIIFGFAFILIFSNMGGTRQIPQKVVPIKTNLDMLIEKYLAEESPTASIDFIMEAEKLERPFDEANLLFTSKSKPVKYRPPRYPVPVQYANDAGYHTLASHFDKIVAEDLARQKEFAVHKLRLESYL